MPRHPIINKRLTHTIIGHFPSSCTIRTVTYTTTAANQKVPSGYADVLGLTNIPALLAPESDNTLVDNEVRDSSITSNYSRRRLKLNGYFPTIVAIRMVAVVDGVMYKIRGIEADSQSLLTRLRVEIITP